MRLQITVLRNCLEPVRNVFNTTSNQYKQGTIVYVSDLLRAVDSFIQLESDSWGFEDYAVETKLNDSQDLAYELFHWQLIQDVLRDDDEVVIRPISEIEMRQRVRGGRHQVRRDGVHLIDGGAWGKGNLLPSDSRPKILIPPRKRAISSSQRQPVELEEEDDEDELQLQIEDVPAPETALYVDGEQGNETDEDEDEDFVDTSETSSETSEDGLEEVDLTKATQNLDNRQVSFAVVESNKGKEIQEAAQVESAENGIPGQELEALKADALKAGYKPDSKKRKRIEMLHLRRTKRKTNRAQDLVPQDAAVMLSLPSTRRATDETMILPTVTFDDTNQINGIESDSSSDYEDTSSSGSSSSSSDRDKTNGREFAHQTHPANDSQLDTSSSGSDSKSGSEDNSDSASSFDSDSDSDSDSTSDSSSDSGESYSAEEQMQKPTRPVTEAVLDRRLERERSASPTREGSRAQRGNSANALEQPVRNSQSSELEEIAHIAEENVPPGQGQNKTKRNNERKKLNKVMKRLKEEGKLHQDANFEELRTYLQENNKNSELQLGGGAGTEDQGDANTDELNARREAVFQKLDETNISDAFGEDILMNTPQKVSLTEHILSENVYAEDIHETRVGVISPNSAEGGTTSELQANLDSCAERPSPKRSRLDVESSRRMLFGALGVRNPKTPAAEQALREKLAKATRKHSQKIVEESQATDTTPAQPLPDRWKHKLIVKAVECVQKNKRIEIPPFPFKHPWQVRKEKEKETAQGSYAHHNNRYFNQESEGYGGVGGTEMDYGDDPGQISSLSYDVAAETLHDHTDDIPLPSDFDVLFDLQQSDLVEGAVIAYKELHLNENFQPEESPYRVARILANGPEKVHLRLAAESRRSRHAKYDEDTGERIYSKFDVPDDDDDASDDGLREISFGEMICPKFVIPSKSAEVVVANYDRSDGQDSTSKRNNSRPEDLSASKVSETQHEVSSSRKAEINEIIKHAGFNSALDEQLIDPLAEAVASREHRINTSSQIHGEDDTRGSEWRSSPASMSSPFKADGESSGARESSAPSESMVESVRYPHLSHLEVDTPMLSAQEQSSSHQDAQRTTPTPVVNTTEVIHSVLEDNIDLGTSAEAGEELVSLPSEVSQSQPLLGQSNSENHQNGPKSLASQQLGLDGSASPPYNSSQISDNDSIDSNGFPSLRRLSQTHRSNGRKNADKLSKDSPEPTRRSERIKKGDPKPSEPSETESSQPIMKASQSQKLQISQIPENTSVVDLTQSSPIGSPAKSTPSSSRSTNGRRGVSSQHASVFKKSFEGLGEKSFLKRKKKSL